MKKRQLLAAFWLLGFLLAAAPLPVRASDSEQLMTALKAMPAQADKFRSLMSNLNASQFHLVNASSIIAGDQAYQSSLKKDASQISDLRDTLSHTTVTGSDGVVVPLRKILSTKNITIEQVIGVYVGSDGQITLYYQ
jgi:hypothetical protein